MHHYGQNKQARDSLRDQPYYQDCVDFCANWDQASFDPDYDSLPLDHFVPLVEALFARTPKACV
jgi:predicted HD phosphohydrolase